ncbi:MAG: LysM peptidoglycan-binding domain-containing protein [Clostridiales bacterium]|nr:LysM peptidoglycan-binding domain-containing protein [Clostridiales bacterium]
MAYLVYVGNVLMPVTPEKITRTVKGNNEEIELISGQTVLNLGEPGLTEWSMDFMLPKVQYPFVNVIQGSQELRSQDYYLTHFNTLMGQKKPFNLMIIRTKPNGIWDLGEKHYDSSQDAYVNDVDGILNNVSVTIESLTDKDDTGEGFDKILSVVFKKYIAYGTKTVSLITDSSSGTVTAAVENTRETDNKEIPTTYTVKSGDTLIGICKSRLGDADKWSEIAELNGLENANKIYVGQVLKLS